MSAKSNLAYREARRAYELGRLRSATWRAALVVVPVAALGLGTSGRSAILALPFTIAAWLFAFWRGDVLLRGAFYGLLGGLATSILPMSILRPCCAAGAPMGAECCTMPGACLGAGALVGVVLAVAVPFGKTTWWRTALGMVLGMSSVAVLKCTTLFAGEAFGLVGGLMAGIVAVTAARLVLGRWRTV
ncbi:MAG TPA: hypothetical protein VM580_03470 [Labilithrix sp.]|nr:hypothetical protein [Labilithrix sp.]